MTGVVANAAALMSRAHNAKEKARGVLLKFISPQGPYGNQLIWSSVFKIRRQEKRFSFTLRKAARDNDSTGLGVLSKLRSTSIRDFTELPRVSYGFFYGVPRSIPSKCAESC